ncbi:MAG: HD domain-containing protein [Faecalibacterium sp.]|jgi:putative nucleotidyltransferase with HDIG domain|nr:HD domain-containing protein [Faecalibacterium sp.]
MEIDRKAAGKAFSAYVQAYDPQNPKIALKIAHTYRVAALCETIAQSQSLCSADIDLAWLTGLLHDVGRFEQVRRYGTFNDAESIDHALLGARILFEEGRIRDYLASPDEDELLETVIRLHSVYRLPQQLGTRARMFCHILRDADKVDILRANCETPLTDIYNVSPQALRTARVSPAVMESFARRQATLRTLKKTPVDNVVALASLTFELVYPVSIRVVQQQGYLQSLLHFETDDPATAAQFAQLRAEMDAYLFAHTQA